MIFSLYHSPGETVGLIGDVIKELRLPFRTVHLHDGEGLPRDTGDLDGLIVMGGPMNVDEVDRYPFLLREVQLIEKVLSEKKPVLGICLGAQLIAKALGQKVYPNKVKEVGWHPIQLTSEAAADPLFKNFPKEMNVLHWHGDTFDLPTNAVHLAKTKSCANQAFRWGENTYALQFHFEVTPAMLNNWCRASCEQSFIQSAGENSNRIMDSTPAAFASLEPISNGFFRSYLKAAYGHLPAAV